MSVGSPAPAHYPAGNANVGEVKTLFVKFVSGNTGAVATLKNYSEVVSLTRTGTGAYTVQFSQAYDHSQNFTGNVAAAAGYVAANACRVVRVYDANESTNGTLKFLTVNSAGTATDPLIGDVIEVEFKVGLYQGTPS